MTSKRETRRSRSIRRPPSRSSTPTATSSKALTKPATVDLATYPVKVEGDDIYVDIPDAILINHTAG
jgi:hypothetical protein